MIDSLINDEYINIRNLLEVNMKRAHKKFFQRWAYEFLGEVLHEWNISSIFKLIRSFM